MDNLAMIIVHREFIGKNKAGKPHYKDTYEWEGDPTWPLHISGELMRDMPHNWLKVLPWRLRVEKHDKTRDLWVMRRVE
jgi:hypothetical protein